MDDEPDIIDAFARYLDGLGLLDYDPTGQTGNCYAETMPPTPDVAVSLTLYDDGTEPDSLLPYDEVRMQVRARGTTDPRVSRALAGRLRRALHGLGPITLPGGVEVVLVVALQGAPASIGQDDNRRHEHVVNVRAEVHNPTPHRP